MGRFFALNGQHQAVIGMMTNAGIAIGSRGVSLLRTDGRELHGDCAGETLVLVEGHPIRPSEELLSKARAYGMVVFTLNDEFARERHMSAYDAVMRRRAPPPRNVPPPPEPTTVLL